MAKNEYSEYQKKVFSGYYDNLDTIMLQKLSELVTELYIADATLRSSLLRRSGCEGRTLRSTSTQTKKDRLWQRAYKAMLNLKIPPAIIDHIMNKKDVVILAKNLQDWLAYKKKK